MNTESNFKIMLAFLLFIFSLFMIDNVYASLGVFKQGTDINLLQTCNNCTYCNLSTITYPNSSIIYENIPMEKDGTSYNYTLNSTYTNAVGQYKYCYDCGNSEENIVGCITLDINHAGVIPTTAQSGLSIAIIVSILFIMIFFGILGFKLTDNKQFFAIGIFFIIISIIIAVYGLYLGLIYSQDYLYSSTSKPQSALFIGILYGLIGMMFISLLILIIMTIKEIKERKSLLNYGEGWNPKTKTYEY